MISDRLELSLERLKPSDWNRFERLSSAFLATEFDDIRTVASASGDEGRDAELFSPLLEPTVVIQYSVAQDWRAKINATVRRLKDTIPGALVLVYMSNWLIGADADSLKQSLRKTHGLSLDVRDRGWFLERVSQSTARQAAAEELAHAIVDPYLSAAGVGPHVQAELSSPEAIAAVTFLGLQWKDEARDKGLTKLTFEALVRAALVDTSSENRVCRKIVHERVQQLLHGHPSQQVVTLVDSALARLAKRTVKHWQKEDEFCLSYEEIQRLNQFRIESALAEGHLLTAVKNIITDYLRQKGIPELHEPEITRVLRLCTDAVLFERSQAFALAAQTGTMATLADADFTSTILSVIAKAALPKIPGVDWVGVLRSGVRSMLISEHPSIQSYLRSLADSYTLLAFLRQTPDVQGAVEKMFSHGMLWLDATVVLPLIADTLVSADGQKGRFTRMIDAARDAGLKLYVTPGIVEEVERHMNRALVCSRTSNGQWEGSIPYLLERYVSAGRSLASFSQWLINFRGESRPLQDLEEYLLSEFRIALRALDVEHDASPENLRSALQTLWYERYQRRRERYGTPLDDMAVTRLVRHDIECYAGIVQLRTKERASPFGYSAWWLTVDKQAFDLKNKLRPIMNVTPPDSPVMSADFLVNYLAFGPIRRHVRKSAEVQLPLLMVMGDASRLSPELLSEAETLRDELKDLPERVIRRQVRDHLDRARSRIGPIANLGMEEADDIEDTLQITLPLSLSAPGKGKIG
ncbi:TPA: hypothetical protein ACT5B2_004224 [Burkholderia cenocepacia]|uniref:hypothetical protein n=1 Tax=Burkholderia cenocepacia TaxID=95486 RepID=UPI002AB5ED16|nr:hypothetical protein [Burkholderia cenocepacia]